MKKLIHLLIFLFALPTVCKAGDIVVTSTVLLNGEEIEAEYLLGPYEASLGSGRNACISQYSTGQLVVPATIVVDGAPFPVTSVSNLAFRLCTNLTSVELPEGVTRVGDFAFKGCRNLTKVTLPSTVETIGTGAFIDLPNLSDFILKATTPPVWEYNDVFFFHQGGISDPTPRSIEHVNLYVPEENIPDYQESFFNDEILNVNLGWITEEGWGNFSGNIYPIEDYIKEDYAVLEDNTLTFYYDGRKKQHSGFVYSLSDDPSAYPSWYTDKVYNRIHKVVFTPSFSEARLKITSKMFYACSSLTMIEGMEYLNTSEVISMSQMFHGCLELTAVDLSHFDTSKCTDFTEMFSMCSMVDNLDLSSFDTSKATSMKEMFFGCDHLKSLDLSYFNTSNVTSFEGMFSYCERLESLHIESFDASANDGHGNKMFEECHQLKSIVIPSSIKYASDMLKGCTSMEDVYYNGASPFSSWSYNSTMLKPDKATRFHVLASQVDAWTTQWPYANCTFVGDLGTDDAPILLYTSADWSNLADIVGLGLNNISAKMMADITCKDIRFVASNSEHPFSGSFDGNGHTLTLNLPYEANLVRSAPFGYVKTATIKNLVVDGTICGGIHSAGLVSTVSNDAELTIENCVVKATISARSLYPNGPHAGGFVGHGNQANISVKGCLFAGTLETRESSSDSYAGAFIGWCDSASGISVTDCYENGTYSNLYSHVDMNFDYTGSPTIVSSTNCYHRKPWNGKSHGYSVTSGTEGLNLIFGTPVTTYDVSGIDAYANGLMIDGTYYTGDGKEVLFGYDNTGYEISNVKANETTPEIRDGVSLGGDSQDTYAFVLQAADYIITADLQFQYIVLKDDATDNTDQLREFISDQATNVQLKDRVLYTDGEWNTLCLPFDLSEEQLAANLNAGYELKILESASFSRGTLTLNFKDATAVPAGLPFIIRWNPATSTDLISPVLNDVTITTSRPGSVKLVFEDSSMGLEFKGIFNRFDIEGEDHTMLYLGGSDMLYYPNGPMSINAFRGYFILYGITAGDPTNPTNVNTFKLNFDGDATEIVALPTDSSDTGNSWFTLSGMKLTTKPTVKGIYINNGQKVVIK